MTAIDIWTFREPGWADTDVVGYSVEAADGPFGEIDEASYETGTSYLVVDTSSLRNLGFGKQALIPAAAIKRVDHSDQTVFLALTKEQIKDAPEGSRLLRAVSDGTRWCGAGGAASRTHLIWGRGSPAPPRLALCSRRELRVD
jgi:hypothetical protein